MSEKTGGHTRREVLKFAAMATISTGVSAETYSLKGEQSNAGELMA